MKFIDTNKRRGFFEPLVQSRSVQAAAMVLRPGQCSSGKLENEHPRCEQWMFVVSGTGRVRVGGRTVGIKKGSLVLIEKGERHQIINTGKKRLVTVNFYAPPAYTSVGDVKPAASR